MNFLIDGAILATTAWTRKIPLRWWRIAAASFIGASYVVLMFFPSLSFMFTFALKVLVSVWMIIIAFGFGSLQHFLRNTASFYVLNFVTGGGIMAMHYFSQSPGEVFNGIVFTQSGGLGFRIKVGIMFVTIAFIIALYIYKRVFRSTKQREAKVAYFAKVQVYIEGFEAVCTGLIDTGNHLYDPLTRAPVMVMEASHWEDVFPDRWMKFIQQAEVERIVMSLGSDTFKWQDRLRLVPYRGVNKGMQFMLAIKPDKVVITHNELATETSKVLVGLDGGKLCPDGTYQAIIHPQLVNQVEVL